MDGLLLAYLAAAALLTITPGLDTALVLRTAVADGKRAAAGAGLGIALGCLVWGLATAAGLGLLFSASAMAYEVLKWVGGAYLAGLAFKLLSSRQEALTPAPAGRGPTGLLRAFRRGLLTNLLNPKVGIFYISFLPQFIPPGHDVALRSVLLTVIHAGLGLLWFASLISLTVQFDTLLRRPNVRLWIDRATGALFLAFAVRLVFDRRT